MEAMEGMSWLLLAIACGIVLLLVTSIGVVMLIKFGVILGEASRSPHYDARDYTLDQGREVRPEQE